MKILMVLTSHDKLGSTGEKTGYWAEEFASPYYTFVDNGYEVDVASPLGGKPPIDPISKIDDAVTDYTKRMDEDRNVQNILSNTLVLKNVKFKDYDAVFFPGGHGPMWDLSTDETSIKIIAQTLKANKPVATVCHGAAVLLHVKDSSGNFIVNNKTVTGFTNNEENMAGLDKVVPFALESELKNKGANYRSATAWGEFVVQDGLIITGQNPASSKATAEKLINTLAG